MENLYNLILFTYLSNLIVFVVVSFVGMIILFLIEKEKEFFLTLLEINVISWLEILIIIGTKKIIPLIVIYLLVKSREKIKRKIKEVKKKQQRDIKLEEWVIRR